MWGKGTGKDGKGKRGEGCTLRKEDQLLLEAVDGVGERDIVNPRDAGIPDEGMQFD